MLTGDLNIKNPFGDYPRYIEGEYLGKDIVSFNIGRSFSFLDNDLEMYCTQRFTQNHLQYPPIDKITVEEKEVMLQLLLKSHLPILFCEDKFEAVKVGDEKYCCIPYRQLEALYPNVFLDRSGVIIDGFL